MALDNNINQEDFFLKRLDARIFNLSDGVMNFFEKKGIAPDTLARGLYFFSAASLGMYIYETPRLFGPFLMGMSALNFLSDSWLNKEICRNDSLKECSKGFDMATFSTGALFTGMDSLLMLLTAGTENVETFNYSLNLLKFHLGTLAYGAASYVNRAFVSREE
ncbi:MAG: hypothetical protein ABIE22_04825 [archaeon]